MPRKNRTASLGNAWAVAARNRATNELSFISFGRTRSEVRRDARKMNNQPNSGVIRFMPVRISAYAQN